MKNSIATSLAIIICTLSSQAYATGTANEVSGVGSNADVIITSDSLWTTVRSVTYTVVGASTNNCMVVASADVRNPNPSKEKQYLFTISHNNKGDGSSPLPENGQAERTVGFVDNPTINDIAKQAVSTNTVFKGLTATNGVGGGNQHVFYFLAKKKLSPNVAPNAVVEDSEIDFVCVRD